MSLWVRGLAIPLSTLMLSLIVPVELPSKLIPAVTLLYSVFPVTVVRNDDAVTSTPWSPLLVNRLSTTRLSVDLSRSIPESSLSWLQLELIVLPDEVWIRIPDAAR